MSAKLDDDIVDKLLRAGEIVSEALSKAVDIVEDGVKVVVICRELEKVIVRKGARPAFPVNVSINDVAAHYTAAPRDDTVIPPHSVVKIDVGAHVDGYIADAALTIVLDKSFEPLAKAAYEALRAAMRSLRHGVRLSSVGAVIEREIKLRGFKPISNLSGHKIERYNLHAGKSVPNVASFDLSRAVRGEVYAIEPFSTNGEGLVVEGGCSNIYRIVSMRRTGSKELDNLLTNLWSEFRGLPFASRWVAEKWGNGALNLLKTLESKRRVYHYRVLIERGGGYVAQFEDTVIVQENGVLPIVGISELVKA